MKVTLPPLAFSQKPRILSVPPSLFILRVSPKAQARAFKSFHLLLTLNTEYGGQGRIVPTIFTKPQNPSVSPFLQKTTLRVLRVRAEGSSESDHHSPAYMTPVVRKKCCVAIASFCGANLRPLFPTI